MLASWNRSTRSRTPRSARRRAAPGLLRAGAAARGHDGRRLRRHRRLPVLRVLRGDARPDVLPHRQLRRPAPAVRGGEVLPVLAGRRPAHAGRGDRPVRVASQRHGTFAFADAGRRRHRPRAVQKWLFLGFFIAFAIKAPLVPFHTWLPDAGAEAPVGGAALLVGVLDKVGTFGFLRYCLPLFPDASRYFAPLVLVLAVVGILYAALLAIGQSDMKRLVAYTSVAHFGFIGARHLRLHHPGRHRRGALHGQPRPRRPALLFLVVGMLIARGGAGMIGDYGGVRQGDAAAGRAVPARRPGRRWRCPALTHVRQRVPGAGRHLHAAQGVRDPRAPSASSWPRSTCCCCTSAPCRAAASELATADEFRDLDVGREVVRGRPADRADPVPRRLPEAGARRDQPGGRRATMQDVGQTDPAPAVPAGAQNGGDRVTLGAAGGATPITAPSLAYARAAADADRVRRGLRRRAGRGVRAARASRHAVQLGCRAGRPGRRVRRA